MGGLVVNTFLIRAPVEFPLIRGSFYVLRQNAERTSCIVGHSSCPCKVKDNCLFGPK